MRVVDGRPEKMSELDGVTGTTWFRLGIPTTGVHQEDRNRTRLRFGCYSFARKASLHIDFPVVESFPEEVFFQSVNPVIQVLDGLLNLSDAA